MELPHTASLLTVPQCRARYAAGLWEPVPGTGEQVAALLLLEPQPGSQVLISPGAHVVIPPARLRAMFGTRRGNSAHGILKLAAEIITQRMVAGLPIDECTPPLSGFSIGPVRAARGFSAEQLIDAAVRSLSAFGSAKELLSEVVMSDDQSTSTTREFLERVKVAFAPSGDSRRKRFSRPVPVSPGRALIIDYVDERNLVQFATTPLTLRQRDNMVREMESKLFRAMTVNQNVHGGQARPLLLINTSPLFTGQLSDSSRRFAEEALDVYHSEAELSKFPVMQAVSHEAAAHLLAAL